MVMLSVDCGVMAGLVLSTYLYYHVVPFLGLIVHVAYLIVSLMLPETVPYLMKRNQLGLTEKYFRKYRNKKGETTKAGFEDLRTSILAQQSMGMTNFYILSPGTSLKVSLGHFAQYYDIGDLSWLLLLLMNLNGLPLLSGYREDLTSQGKINAFGLLN